MLKRNILILFYFLKWHDLFAAKITNCFIWSLIEVNSDDKAPRVGNIHINP